MQNPLHSSCASYKHTNNAALHFYVTSTKIVAVKVDSSVVNLMVPCQKRVEKEENLMGKSPVGLRTLLCSELRKVGTAAVPGCLERCIGGDRRLEAVCLRLSLRRIDGRLGCAMYRGWGCGSRGERCLVGVEDVLVPGSRQRLEGAVLGVVEDCILHRLLLNRRVGWRDGLR